MNIATESELGVIIRERRKTQGLTIAGLSMMVPCDPRLLGELERGKRGVGIILRLLVLLGLTVDIRGREESESLPSHRKRIQELSQMANKDTG